MARYLLLLCLLFAAPSWAFEAKVVKIMDGDTLGVLKGGRMVKVRLHGIDAPEKGQPFGAKSKAFLGERAFGKMVEVDEKDTDRYGRVVAVVRLGGEDLNLDMVRAGLAWHFVRYAPHDDALQKAEREAREGRWGLWEATDPIPPWEWRKAKREKKTPAGD